LKRLSYSEIEIPALDKLTGPSSLAAPITAKVLLEAAAAIEAGQGKGKAREALEDMDENEEPGVPATATENGSFDRFFAKERAARVW
jgi:hypothetical protein